MDATSLAPLTSTLGISTSFLMSGVYLCSSLVAVPSILHLPAAQSTNVFHHVYHSGVKVVVPLSIISTTFFAASAYGDPSRRVGYTVAGALAIASMPWTVAVMGGMNQELLAMSTDGNMREKVGEEGVRRLLRRWIVLNGVRAGFALVAGIVGGLAFTGGL